MHLGWWMDSEGQWNLIQNKDDWCWFWIVVGRYYLYLYQEVQRFAWVLWVMPCLSILMVTLIFCWWAFALHTTDQNRSMSAVSEDLCISQVLLCFAFYFKTHGPCILSPATNTESEWISPLVSPRQQANVFSHFSIKNEQQQRLAMQPGSRVFQGTPHLSPWRSVPWGTTKRFLPKEHPFFPPSKVLFAYEAHWFLFSFPCHTSFGSGLTKSFYGDLRPKPILRIWSLYQQRKRKETKHTSSTQPQGGSLREESTRKSKERSWWNLPLYNVHKLTIVLLILVLSLSCHLFVLTSLP